MGNKAKFAADMLRRIGEDVTQYADVLKGMAPFGNCDAREMGDVFMNRIAVWKALVSDLPPGNDSHSVLDSDVEFKQDRYEMVDLGLPSGLKWADRNVGAATPEAFGDYFMWGSVTPDTNRPYDWAHAPFNDGRKEFDKEYFNANKSRWVDGGVLASEYDAAHVIMGDTWRIPTEAEIRELVDGTTKSVEELNGVKGMRFTSKSNRNSVFMPFAGYRDGSDVRYVGDGGYAWSSSLGVRLAYNSHSLRFNGDGDAYVDEYGRRCLGFVVRGVCL